ncbi:M23 family metallopeptidase [Spongiivirga sp. MCCC 1A20706]|uniref:M23 family metallopeptidase n=1 Tax=Spongiivirga sp. MCCC 1A20706 TaxID=3160963 RepID=UPI00397765FE
MAKKKEKRKQFKRKLLHQYRMVVLNEETFEERFSFKLTRLNVFVVGTLCSLVLIALTVIFIAFTPIREYIPGYSSTALKEKATLLTYKTDSLEHIISRNNMYLNSVRKVLTGDISGDEVNKDSLFEEFNVDKMEIDLDPIKEDSILREEVSREDKFNLFDSATSKVGFVPFTPVSGTISQGYNPKEKHYAVDVVVKEGTPIKSVADGTVIFAGWTTDTGYVMIIEHANSLLSVYKHNESLTKEQGELVKAGEVIATSGSTGELTTGPHLHFELWSDGYPMNPTNFIDFE